MFTVRGTWMRGGTSKCWLFNAVDIDPLIPVVGSLDTILSAAFGSGDPRQLDGIGGGSSTTSKAAVVRRSSYPGIDIDYLFAQVAIADRTVEWSSNCGNCATAIGLYAVQTGLVAATSPSTRVRMRNDNTGAVLIAEIATPGGRIPFDGDARVPGTTAVGVPVELTFDDPAAGGALFPTGSVQDRLTLGAASFPATLVAAGAPAALIDPRGTELIAAAGAAERFAEIVPTLMSLRRAAALRMGLSRPEDPISNAVPKVGIVTPPADYRTSTGDRIAAGDYDIAVRMVSMLAPHPAIGLTAAVAVATAATVPGTTVADITGTRGRADVVRIGTAAGVVPVDIVTDDAGRLRGITLHRAARRIATAELFVAPPALLASTA